MIYYVSGSMLYSSEFPVSHPDFVEISQEEYMGRLSKAVSGREKGTPINLSDLIED